jgi:hypothetical protein
MGQDPSVERPWKTGWGALPASVSALAESRSPNGSRSPIRECSVLWSCAAHWVLKIKMKTGKEYRLVFAKDKKPEALFLMDALMDKGDRSER